MATGWRSSSWDTATRRFCGGGRKNCFFESATDLQNYPCKLASIRPDIGLCPLTDTAFNRCKSPIKWMEYAMAGAATVASPVEPYLHGPSMVPGDLLRTLRLLVEEDAELRKTVARQDAAAVRTYFAWQSESAREPWLNTFRTIAGAE